MNFVRPDGLLPSDPLFVYHATNEERAAEIARTGLKTHKPWEFTNQEVWPDGGEEPRVYFSPRASAVWAFAPEEGRPVILRVPRGLVRLRNEGTGDVYVREKVPAKALEILLDTGWAPLTQVFGRGLGDGETEAAIAASTGGWQRVRDREAAVAVIWPMVVATYAKIGNPHRTPAELAEYDGEWVLHFTEGKPDAFQLTKRTRYGRKMGLGGSTGTLAAKVALKDFFVSFSNVEGGYGEVSHAVEAVVTKANVPAVCAWEVGAVLGKEIRVAADGLHYTRKITGVGEVTKVMVGRPRGVPTTRIQTPNCPTTRLAALTRREVMMVGDSDLTARAAHLMMQSIL